MATLQQAIDQIVDAVGVLTGVRHAPDEPTDKIPAYPAMMTFLQGGVYHNRPIGVMTGVHTVLVEVVVARKDLERDVQTVMGYAKSVPNAIYKAHAAGTLTAIEEIGDISYEFGPMSWGGANLIGFRFKVDGVKTQDTIA
jgi:hypothetical protein